MSVDSDYKEENPPTNVTSIVNIAHGFMIEYSKFNQVNIHCRLYLVPVMLVTCVKPIKLIFIPCGINAQDNKHTKEIS